MAITYTERFAALVEEIVTNVKRRKSDEALRFAYEGRSYDLHARGERMALIKRVADDYVAAHAESNQVALDTWISRGCKNERPAPVPLDSPLIDRLTDAVLDEELTDPHPDKVTRDEYPFMSDWQLELRRDKETGLKAVEETGTDGRDYRKPSRRRRSRYENWRVDRDAHGRNAARKEQYKRDSSPGPVVNGVLSEPFVAARQQAERWRALSGLANAE